MPERDCTFGSLKKAKPVISFITKTQFNEKPTISFISLALRACEQLGND